MHRKIRLITTLFTILSLSIIISISLPLAIYAATSAKINGNGSLNVTEIINVENQKDALKACGLHPTGNNANYMTLGDMKESDLKNPSTLRNEAINTAKILSFSLYKKIDCVINADGSQDEIYMLQVNLDFSAYNIFSYASNCITYFNRIVFATTETGENYQINLNIYDYYTGVLIDNANVTFNPDYSINVQVDQEVIEVDFSYNIVLNTLPERELIGNEDKYGIRSNAFTMQDKIPSLILIDLSKTNIYLDENGLHGFEYDTDNNFIFSNEVNHYHFIASKDEQLAAAMFIAKEYANYDTDSEISLYKRLGSNQYQIECKININDSNLKIIVIDKEAETMDTLGIINMAKWCINNLENDTYQIYNQSVDENHRFSGNEKLVEIVNDGSQYNVSIDGEIIGSFTI